ncbi:GNAT family N-acetyltransferase [Kribbella sp. NPDC005582]|uniref:GNAT family N-acetyltransferase n=1 Tax=Kribbella sp. NPDC005582 TaxID=3156893 RepID=UPI0033B88252
MHHQAALKHCQGLAQPGPALPEESKKVLGFWDGDQLVAIADLLRGYPHEHTASIGLLQVHGLRQGHGTGAAAYRELQRYVEREWLEVRTLRLAVVDTNAQQAQGFWVRQGFEATGEVKPYKHDTVESVARLYEKQLGRTQPQA